VERKKIMKRLERLQKKGYKVIHTFSGRVILRTPYRILGLFKSVTFAHKCIFGY
jgi:hypothetical protein